MQDIQAQTSISLTLSVRKRWESAKTAAKTSPMLHSHGRRAVSAPVTGAFSGTSNKEINAFKPMQTTQFPLSEAKGVPHKQSLQPQVPGTLQKAQRPSRRHALRSSDFLPIRHPNPHTGLHSPQTSEDAAEDFGLKTKMVGGWDGTEMGWVEGFEIQTTEQATEQTSTQTKRWVCEGERGYPVPVPIRTTASTSAPRFLQQLPPSQNSRSNRKHEACQLQRPQSRSIHRRSSNLILLLTTLRQALAHMLIHIADVLSPSTDSTTGGEKRTTTNDAWERALAWARAALYILVLVYVLSLAATAGGLVVGGLGWLGWLARLVIWVGRTVLFI